MSITPMNVTYKQGGELKTIDQDQAIQMLEQIAQHDMQRALVHYHKLTQDNPDALGLLQRFYDHLLSMYMFDELLELTSKRLAEVPRCKIAFSSKLDALRHMFRNQEAIQILREAYLADPRDYDAVSILGTFYKAEGDFDKALSSFNQAIDVNRYYSAAYWHRAELVTDHAAAYQQLIKQIGEAEVQESNAYYLQFAAYRHAEKLGDYQAAFEHLSFGNGLKRQSLDYDLAQELAVDEKAKQVFNPSRLASLQADGKSLLPSELRPIFILGMPRSGTTLVEQIIASHSKVAGGDEYTALANAIMRVQRHGQSQLGVDEWLASLRADDLSKIAKAYDANMRFVRGDKKVFTDKNQFNHRSVGVIAAALPKAKIIVVERQPMDVLFGCYRQLFGGNGAPFSYDITELVAFYNSYMSLIDYWAEHTQGLIKRVQYEDLVAKPKQVTDDLLAFCDLDVEQACYDFHKTQRSVKTLSGAQVRRPIFTDGVGRWKTYQTQLSKLIQAAEKAGIEIG